MPDAAGNIKGSGWSREREAGWERVFGRVRTHDLPDGRVMLCGQSAIRPHRCPVCDPAPEGAGSDEG